MKSIQDVLLGYLVCMESPTMGASFGGLLVTNHRGIPIEFRYTDPVQVNEFQQLLYGGNRVADTLAGTVAQCLWNAVEQKPRVLFVEDASLPLSLEQMPYDEETLVVCLEVAPDESFHLPEQRGAVLASVEAGSQRMARAHVIPDDPDTLSVVERLLGVLHRQMRINEPFERVEAVLRALHKLPQSESRRPVAALPTRGEQPTPPSRAAVPTETLTRDEEIPTPPVRRRTESDDFSPEAITERVRRFTGKADDATTERFRALRASRDDGRSSQTASRPESRDREVALRNEEPAPRRVAASVMEQRAALRGVPEEDTDLKVTPPTSPVRSDEETLQWKQRFARWTSPTLAQAEAEEARRDADPLPEPAPSSWRERFRAETDEDREIPAIVRMGNLKNRPDLNFLFEKGR
jgi:hypothetical protein